jgi:hypothetical protein
LVIVRLLFSQRVDPDTKLPVSGAKTTFQEKAPALLVSTPKVVCLLLDTVIVVPDVSPLLYDWFETAEPLVAPQLSPVYSWIVSVPLMLSPFVAETEAESFGYQVCADDETLVSVTVKHSVTLESCEPV